MTLQKNPEPALATDGRTLDRQVSAPIGQVLQRIRRDNNWTLAEVSRRTGVSISSLSKIENNQSTPAYSVLVRLAEGLDIDFAELFGGSTQSFAAAARVITRAGQGTTYTNKMGVYEALAAGLAEKSMQPMVIDIPGLTSNQKAVRSAHKAEEFVYVIGGAVTFFMEPYAPVVLQVGDSVYFDSASEHGFSSTTEQPARILSVCLERPGTTNYSIEDIA
ncbi:helix-turn-helix domain-containing protein [Agrobacterium vitis]|uniref:helix-turn-helix domain-containing protein n=1 Tax=Rhizobium/Agrobacterium group TaxID=227290 RepID=UPI0008DC0284|nr:MULTISPECIES: XRE family transcriptional regulator [Rhizobium/Agrobacterium group]MCF1436619.1 helix-turn-helix domain-containing protein [Allorhizobium ampelinum]MUO91860.1 helix-turn-helix domain-containing protein [Agrobacterium vitis]MUZ55304.1 helix-turn-helix domain-containing protein [Agrobacterium vitis]MUZ94529.1 helix-turn-helix domain-containing protein [Agrobacterium vitis]MVA42848.1 helix-turn-helix domain-containing protein [Agrobacterium vitis]